MNKIHNSVDRLDLNLLKVFEAIYREQNLTRAANHLSLSPSAISHALRRLREHLNDPLFVKEGRNMRPTPVCARMAPELLEEISRLRSILLSWGQFDPETSKIVFSIGMPDATEIMLLPELVDRVRKLAPNVSLIGTRYVREEMDTSLSGHTLDICIDVTIPTSKQLRQFPLISDSWCIVSRGRKINSIEEYCEKEHVAVSTRAVGTILEDPALEKLGINRDVRVRCQNYYGAIAVVERSDHVLTMPRRLAKVMANGEQFNIYDVPFHMPSIDLNIYWHKDNDEDSANQWLRNIVVGITEIFE
ncbi:LysR family transcriptional regulator [Hirschia maritima]|uniref:LysR family transcriptional regulator n=1 Tax=Hirschia maritima TaxID=1121961 RepID=UPI0003A80E99|nr:LysR family transcriptional regulator [Hirschia maritima]